MKMKPRQSCVFRRRPRQQTNLDSKQSEDCREQTSQTRQSHPSNIPDPPLKMKTVMTWTSQRPESPLSAPQLQTQLSRHTDRTRLRRLKNTLLSKGAWQLVTRIEDLCHVALPLGRMRRKCPDYITNVQNRLVNKLCVVGGLCRCCGFFLDPQLEHAETCSTAEATRGHYACVQGVVCGRPGHYYETPEGSPLRNPGLLISSPPQPLDVAPPWTYVWHPPLLRPLAETQRRRYLIGNFHIIGTKLWNCGNKTFTIAPLIWTADGRPHPAVTQALQYAADIAFQSERAADVGEITSAQVET